MNGVEACKLIRSNEAAITETIPLAILGVTGNALSEDVSEFTSAGCDEVLYLQFYTLAPLF